MLLLPLFHLLIICHCSESQLQTVTNVLRQLYEQEEILPEFPVNIFVDSATKEFEYLKAIQNNLSLSVLSSQSPKDYLNKFKSLRMKWQGWVNVLELKDSNAIEDYFRMIRKKWYTSDELQIGEERMMDFIYENIIHVMILSQEEWKQNMNETIQSIATEEMLILLILYSADENDFNVYFNRATSNGLNQLMKVNYWSKKNGFTIKGFLYPSHHRVYLNLHGRTFKHPLIHKPPWNYVTYGSDKEFIEDNGGRDITLVDVLSQKLNFNYESLDPLQVGVRRTRGSKFDSNLSFPGIIGAIHSRKKDFIFYLGDTTQTYNRNKAVDFSFYVLADAGAFVTVAQKSFIPSDILVKPFALDIWAIVVLCFIIGCIMLIFTHVDFFKNNEEKNVKGRVSSMILLMNKLFLSQSDKIITENSENNPNSFRIILATYAIMINCTLSASYSGMLVSFFSLPSYGKTLNTLEELNAAMSPSGSDDSMALGVVRGSSSYGMISTGGGVYGEIWDKMQYQDLYLLNSVSQGLDEVMANPKFAVFAGRQKLIFDTLRLGGKRIFHVNESPFFVKYKCVAFRYGSPLKEVFNDIILRLHAGGIIDRITKHEFNGLKRRTGKYGEYWEEQYKIQKIQGDSGEKGLSKIALKHIIAIFYILMISHFLSFLIFLVYETKFLRKVEGNYP